MKYDLLFESQGVSIQKKAFMDSSDQRSAFSKRIYHQSISWVLIADSWKLYLETSETAPKEQDEGIKRIWIDTIQLFGEK